MVCPPLARLTDAGSRARTWPLPVERVEHSVAGLHNPQTVAVQGTCGDTPPPVCVATAL